MELRLKTSGILDRIRLVVDEQARVDAKPVRGLDHVRDIK